MNRQDFIKCVESSQESLRRFLTSLCNGNVALAEDIAQEAYIKAFLSIDSLAANDSFRPWVMKIAYNSYLNYIRKNYPEVGVEDIKENESDMHADDSFRYENLYQALSALPLRQRSALTLFYLEGYSTHEISVILEISEENVRQTLSRGRNKLKNLIY